MRLDPLTVVWLGGANCDGCTIKALGETTGGGLEALLTGKSPNMPRVRLIHPVLSMESGSDFVRLLEDAAAGELGPYVLVNEAAVPDELRAATGFFSSLGESADGAPIPVSAWLDRLAPRALAVLAWGDCAVWGGPHALGANPTGSTGTAMHLGVDYRSTLGLPVINLPGCAAPPVLIRTLAALVAWMRGEREALELDATNRPAFAYGERWKGALAAWSE
jgi:hydrogenase small subunit